MLNAALLAVRIRCENRALAPPPATGSAPPRTAGVIDLLVAGGGPAGLATALHAALAGLEAVVVEPRTRPVDKACGEGLMPGGVAALPALGVDLAGAATCAASATSTGAAAPRPPSATAPGSGCAAPPCTPRCTGGPPNSVSRCCRGGSARYARARTR